MSNEKTVLDIVAEWLTMKGYDGLVNTGIECGCKRDNLAPCGDMDQHCAAAYEHPGNADYDFIMDTRKELPKDEGEDE